MTIKKSEKTKSVSCRLAMHEYASLVDEAEKNNTSVSEILRRSRFNSNKQEEIATQFVEFEQRLIRKIFEVVAAIANIGDEDRISAIQKYKQKLREGIKNA